ncbi:hypothetical protein ND861_00925 [Leptospira sp. 2 VSF19]|uniref:Lipoprotein n=1 Tax=Leptospira soteropolitanensis TaxID=2950025 RepID=A0AAW5VGR1_9LEPT|nr:hypothetical protein [Leptospira soteropolitanensis]MCW7491206.1 hypothetical protein [Leptospira soteropolitanensis]MCW7498790.1 hypothetical protein [Leptospira soteropolitanensis]MCW7521617.1 hypothetical protein [Leptospira soteropolitanensis]MCW7524894.1 hypothetical protein [Leptospira soteropolitanensis]MCW7528761.1 hypothetical protein [Leptospira soteropolitanensis]
MKHLVLRYTFIFGFLAFFTHCTFGSVGDSNKDKLAILQNLIFFNNNQTIPIGTNLRSYDDQADDNLNQFSLTSNAVVYNITVQSGSFINWETGTYRINPPNQTLGVSTSGSEKSSNAIAKTHTPYTVPLDLPADDLYGKSYSFLSASTVSNITQYNSTMETGASFLFPNTRLSNIPMGVVAVANVSWEEIYIRMDVTGGTTKSVTILLSQGNKQITPKCKIPVKNGRSGNIEILVSLSGFFQDRSVSGTPIRFLDTLSGKADPVVISKVSNVDLYNILLQNLQAEDIVFSFPGCFPGVER